MQGWLAGWMEVLTSKVHKQEDEQWWIQKSRKGGSAYPVRDPKF